MNSNPSAPPTVSELVQRAAGLSGGMASLARRLGVARSAPYSWTRVPARHVLKIEAATGGGLTRHAMRPDLYPELSARGC